MFQPSPLPDQQTAEEACRKAIAGQFSHCGEGAPEARVYLLLERGLDRRLIRLAECELKGYPHRALFENTPEAHLARDLSPWLVALEELPAPQLLDQLVRASQRHAAVAWLWSPLGLDALADHLRVFMGAVLWNDKTGSEEGEIALRCTDPRVFPGFFAALNDEQRTALLLPLECWALWDRHLNWRVWAGAANGRAEPAQPLRISLSQLGIMNRETQPDKILSLLDDEYGAAENAVKAALLDLPADERFRAAWQLIQEGRQLGYGSDRDLMLFVSLAYLIHPRYVDFPLMGSAIRQGGQRGEPLAATIDNLPDQAWQEAEAILAREYEANTTPTSRVTPAFSF